MGALDAGGLAAMNTGTPIIQFQHHEEDGCWWSESPQMPGWSAAGASLEEVKQIATEAVLVWEDDYGFSGQEIVIHVWGIPL